MKEKKWYIKLDVQKQYDNEFIHMVKQDIYSNALYITLTNNGTLVSFDDITHISVIVDKPDATQVIGSGEIVKNGLIKYVVDYQAISAIGITTITLKIHDNEGVMTTASFNLKVIEDPYAGTNGSIQSTSAYPVLTELIDRHTQYVAAENSRVAAELLRVDAEATRDSNELDRLSNEDIRTANEIARIEDEDIRGTNETARVGSENIRASNESSRVTVEANRVLAEGTREENETERISNENTRKSSETSRGNAESLRVTQEDARKAAELIRISNEEDRIAAEGLRDGAYNQAELARDGLYSTAEAARDNDYTDAETARDGLYDAAEANRDSLYNTAEAARDVKMGTLANLTTTEKGSIVGAVNEIDAELTAHKEDYVAEVGEINAQLAETDQKISRNTDLRNKMNNVKTLTNIVSNGDMSDGITGYTSISSSNTVNGNTLVNTTDGSTTYAMALKKMDVEVPVGHLVLFKFRVKTNASAKSINVHLAGEGSGSGSVNNVWVGYLPETNVWKNVEFIQEVTPALIGKIQIKLAHDYDIASAGNEMEVQYLAAFDITASFGSGDEPGLTKVTQTLEDNFTFGWFDGEEEISFLNLKNKAVLNVSDGDISWSTLYELKKQLDELGSSGGIGSNFKIMLTFDDSTSDHYDASKIMDEYGVKGTFYAITGRLGLAGYLTNEQVIDMHTNGHEIGSHTVSHPDLTTLTELELRNELKNSKEALEILLNDEVVTFAYTFGANNSETHKEALNHYMTVRLYDAVSAINTQGSYNAFAIHGISGLDREGKEHVKSLIDHAKKMDIPLVLAFHVIGDTGFPSQDFREVIEYAQSIQSAFSTMKDAFASPSLINDINFERGLSAWFKTNPNADHSIFNVVNEGENNEPCLKITGDGTTSRTIFQEFPVINGEELLGKIQFQSENRTSGTIFISIDFYDFNRNQIGSTTSVANISSNYEWQFTPETNRKMTVPVGAVIGRFRIAASLWNGVARLRTPMVMESKFNVFD